MPNITQNLLLLGQVWGGRGVCWVWKGLYDGGGGGGYIKVLCALITLQHFSLNLICNMFHTSEKKSSASVFRVLIAKIIEFSLKLPNMIQAYTNKLHQRFIFVKDTTGW